jgi:O-acetyl-ADP-ribose deacetylase (regulator of RNase III)
MPDTEKTAPIARIGETELFLIRGDITEISADAIVNAANAYLAGGGGVDGAIHRKAGPSIKEETKLKYPHGCPTGSAVPTSAGNLTAKFIFHAVGPIWQGGQSGEEELLRNTYAACLKLAREYQCESMAFPSISSGAYGYPIDEAAAIAVQTITEFLTEDKENRLKTIYFSLFSENTFRIYENCFKENPKK